MFSYGSDNSLELNAEPITQLVGLNGHGKSSIPLILEETLFNKNSKGIKKADVINRHLDTQKYSASVEFSIDDNTYVLSVTRSGASQKVSLRCNGSDISSHTATDTFREVEKLLGKDFKTFSQLVYQNSNSSLQFLTATDTARKSFLIDLLDLEHYVRIFEQLKEAHKIASETLSEISVKTSTITTWLEKHKSKAGAKTKTLVAVPSLDTPIRDQLAELKTRNQQLSALNKKITKNQEYKKHLAAIKIEPCEDQEVDYSSESARLAVVKHELQQETAKVKKYSAVTADTCGTCYQPVDKTILERLVAEARAQAAALGAEVKMLTDKIAEAKAINERVSEHQTLVAEFEKYSALIDETLPELIQHESALAEQIAELTEQLTALQTEHDEAVKHNTEAEKYNAGIEAAAKQLTEYQTELTKLQPMLESVKAELAVIDVLKKAFSTNGLIAYKIESSVKVLEQLTNTYLAELSDGRFQLEFSLVNDKLNVLIIDGGNTIAISALSAGELTRVTTATLLAIRKLMSSISSAQINVLFLDETIEALDAAGKEKLIEVLLAEENLNTFLVSHSYSHPLVTKVMVVKEQGVSRLET